GVSYDTTKTTWTTSPEKCHINLVPCDSSWETKFAQTLESMPEVKAYVKNQNLGFKIPYTFEGWPRNYYPDYLLRIDDGRGMGDLLNLIVEISGEKGASKAVRVSVGPEFGTVGPEWIKQAALEAMRGSQCDLLLVCGFAFDPHVSEQT